MLNGVIGWGRMRVVQNFSRARLQDQGKGGDLSIGSKPAKPPVRLDPGIESCFGTWLLGVIPSTLVFLACRCFSALSGFHSLCLA